MNSSSTSPSGNRGNGRICRFLGGVLASPLRLTGVGNASFSFTAPAVPASASAAAVAASGGAELPLELELLERLDARPRRRREVEASRCGGMLHFKDTEVLVGPAKRSNRRRNGNDIRAIEEERGGRSLGTQPGVPSKGVHDAAKGASRTKEKKPILKTIQGGLPVSVSSQTNSTRRSQGAQPKMKLLACCVHVYLQKCFTACSLEITTLLTPLHGPTEPEPELGQLSSE